ncbi:MAG TPA: hypothetical protein VFK70_20475, partial [Vicinamibacteria bacterium]|nr:hypothetical protein [Vicinamibacteria bacterium]
MSTGGPEQALPERRAVADELLERCPAGAQQEVPHVPARRRFAAGHRLPGELHRGGGDMLLGPPGPARQTL